jgi:tetratricopeptide (TPR) repeat protein
MVGTIGGQRHLRIRWRLAAIVACILLVLILGAYWLHGTNNQPIANAPDLVNKADSEANYSEAVRVLLNEIAHTSPTDKVRLGELYSNLAGEYINEANYDKAIASYNKAANENGMTSDIAKQMAYIYIKMNNNAQAVVYLKKAIDLWPKSSPMYSAETRALQQTIDDLQKKGHQ